MLFVAHRGESLEAPENTLAAFFLAWERNCPCIECDVRLTADEEIVCMHDESTLRTTGFDLVVANTPYNLLWRLDAGAWMGAQWKGEPIPKLAEVLSEMPPDGRIYIEIKSQSSIVEHLKKVIEKVPVSLYRITLLAFDREVATRAKAAMPDIRICLLTGFEESAEGVIPLSEELVDELRELGVDGVSAFAHNKLSVEYVRKIKDAGFSFHVWTVDDDDEARRFIDMGVDSITSNRASSLSRKLNS